VSLRMLADLRLTTEQQRTTGQNLPSDLYYQIVIPIPLAITLPCDPGAIITKCESLQDVCWTGLPLLPCFDPRASVCGKLHTLNLLS
jgi:hypothetical protein